MPDYMYMLESRLSPEQRAALVRMQELAQWLEMNVYLTGGAVRDLITGMPIRDLDFTVEGNPSRMLRELEKGGARVLDEDERLRSAEVIFAGDVDGSIVAARDEVYERPGTKPEVRWSTVMEDLRRRDFSVNAIALSLNSASRGLLLDPTNGLADLEKREIRVLSIHAFTNQPARIVRAVHYSARLGFKMEERTKEWFELARERGLEETIEGREIGREVRQLGREEAPVAILKAIDHQELLGTFHPSLARRRPDYEGLGKLVRGRDTLLAAGQRARLFIPVAFYVLNKLKARERSVALHRMEFRQGEIDAILHLDRHAAALVKDLKGRKTGTPRDAFFYIDALPREMMVFLLSRRIPGKAQAKLRNYMQKWKPLRMSLPAAELDALGVPRGAKFDDILEKLFEAQLRGKGRKPEDRTKLLRNLAGIKPEPKKKPKEEKKASKKALAKKLGEHAAKAAEKSAAEAAGKEAAAAVTEPPARPEAPKKAAKSAKAPEKPAAKRKAKPKSKRKARKRR